MDSLTRVAHAGREIGLALGEPASARGYPPSAIAMLPNLIERAGADAHGTGSITAIYTVLADGDDGGGAGGRPLAHRDQFGLDPLGALGTGRHGRRRGADAGRPGGRRRGPDQQDGEKGEEARHRPKT